MYESTRFNTAHAFTHGSKEQNSSGLAAPSTMMGVRSVAGAAAAVVTALTLLTIYTVDAKVPFAISQLSKTVAFHRPNNVTPSWRVLRGGADVLEDEDEYDFEEDEDEYDEEEEEKLAASTVKATQKARAKVTAEVKKVVNENMSTTRKKRKSLLKFLRIPYIIRASLNPFTLMAMTKGYFSSLINYNFMREDHDPSKELRSALEEKAKKSGSTGGGRKRKMRPGQARTLSDLPPLNT